VRRSLFFIGALILLTTLATGPPADAAPQYKPVTYFVNDDASGANTGASWRDAFNDLQSALDAAVATDEIWVAAGTYRPSVLVGSTTDARAATFSLKTGVDLYGGFHGTEKKLAQRQLDQASTVLSGNIGSSTETTDNAYHVLYADGVTDAVLDGFTVTEGRGAATEAGRGRGAGMLVLGGSPAISNCTFANNQIVLPNSMGMGGGIYSLGSALTVTGSTFVGNVVGHAPTYASGAGGGIYAEAGTLAVLDCTFTANSAGARGPFYGGGGIYSLGAFLTVTNSRFERNSADQDGGAIGIPAGGETKVTNSVFDRNSAMGYGGAVYASGMLTLTNNTFYRNGWTLTAYPNPLPRAHKGGALYALRGRLSLTNNIFSSNAAYDGGAIFGSEARLGWYELSNNLFYENVGYNHPNYFPNDLVVTGPYSEVDSVYGLDPKLVAPSSGDFHLQPTSPCIDAGWILPNRWWNAFLPTTDFEGDKRIIDGDGVGGTRSDIGADEYVPTLAELRDLLLRMQGNGDIDEATATRFLGYVERAQTALGSGDPVTANAEMNALIVDVKATLGDTPTSVEIERKASAVLGTFD
jgi:predicted outer membrane repeat protein